MIRAAHGNVGRRPSGAVVYEESPLPSLVACSASSRQPLSFSHPYPQRISDAERHHPHTASCPIERRRKERLVAFAYSHLPVVSSALLEPGPGHGLANMSIRNFGFLVVS